MSKKMAYVNGGTLNLTGKECYTLQECFDRIVETEEGKGIYYYDKNGNVVFSTYSEIRDSAYKLLYGLQKQGYTYKDMIILQCFNAKDFVECFWACMYGGYIPLLANVPKSLDDLTATDSLTIKNIWEQSKKPGIMVSSQHFNEYKEFLGKMQMEDAHLININKTQATNGSGKKEKVHPTDTALMFFTSGSTGMPKGVIQTNYAAVRTVYGQIQLNKTTGDNLLNWMPLEHAGGILMSHMRAILNGNNQIQVATEYILEDPLRWLDLMNQYRVSYSWAPHFAYVLINDLVGNQKHNWDLSCVESLIDGGEMVHSKSAKEFLEKLKPYNLSSKVLHPTWGMCETCSGTIYNQDFDNNPLSGVQMLSKKDRKIVWNCNIEDSDVVTEIGEPIPGCEIKIVNENNEIVPEDTIGRFLIKGDSITQGYYNNPEANQESYTSDGWFVTGDIGFIHNGKMTITGREKDIIIVNGMNYNNVEIESVIEENVNVIKSFTAICSVIDRTTQKDIIIAFYVPNNKNDIKKINDEIKQIIFEKMNIKISYTIPVDKKDIPKTNLGKIQRKKLAKNFQEGKYPIDVENVDVINNKLSDIEREIKKNLCIKDIAIIANDNKELEYVHLSKYGVSNKSISDKEIRNEELSEVQTILQDLKGIKAVTVKYDRNMKKLFVFYNPSLSDLEFNSFIANKIIEILTKKLISQYIIIPIFDQDVSNADIDMLIKLYDQGEYSELINDLDLHMKNSNVVPKWFYKEILAKADIPVFKEKDDTIKLVICNDASLINAIQTQATDRFIFLTSQKENCCGEIAAENIKYIDFSSDDNVIRVLQEYKDVKFDIIHLTGCENYYIDGYNSFKDSQYETVINLNTILRCIKKLGINDYHFIVVTKNALYLENSNNQNYAVSTVSGYVKAAVDEGYNVKHVDIDSNILDNDLLDIIYKEVHAKSDIQIVYRNGVRYKILLERTDFPRNLEMQDPLVNEGVYVVTGGMGGIALEIANILLEKYKGNILLLGRSKLTPKQEEDLSMLRQYKGSVKYQICDVTDYKTEKNIIENFIKSNNKKLNGIIHLAGIFRDKLINEQTAEDIFEMYNAKVFATCIQAKLVEENPGAIFITTSSARTINPGATVSAYCSASEFNEHIVGYLNNIKKIKAFCISWSQWSNIGMNQNSSLEEYLEEKGFKRIESENGKSSFLVSLRLNEQTVYVGIDPTKEPIRRKILSEKSRLCLEVFVDYADVKCEEYFASVVKDTLHAYLGKISNYDINIHYLIDLPKDKNGELDKIVLQNRLGYIKKNKAITLPENTIEKKTFNCWKEIFPTVEFGTTDKFFELGGDSILLLKLVALLKKEFCIDLKTQTIFRLNTIRQQADYISSNLSSAKENVYAKESEKTKSVDKNKLFDLSFEQIAEWNIETKNRHVSNNIGLKIFLGDNAVIPCVKMALVSLAEKYNLMRTRYIEDNSTVKGMLDEEPEDFSIEDVFLDSSNDENVISRFCQEQLEYKFDLFNSKKMCAYIANCENSIPFMFLVFSRMIMNEYRALLFAEELEKTYLDIMNGTYSSKKETLNNLKHKDQMNQYREDIFDSNVNLCKKRTYSFTISQGCIDKIKNICNTNKYDESIFIFSYIIYKLYGIDKHAKEIKAVVHSGDETIISDRMYARIIEMCKEDFFTFTQRCMKTSEQKLESNYGDYDVLYLYRKLNENKRWNTELITGKESYGHLNIYVLENAEYLDVKLEYDGHLWTDVQLQMLSRDLDSFLS